MVIQRTVQEPVKRAVVRLLVALSLVLTASAFATTAAQASPEQAAEEFAASTKADASAGIQVSSICTTHPSSCTTGRVAAHPTGHWLYVHANAGWYGLPCKFRVRDVANQKVIYSGSLPPYGYDQEILYEVYSTYKLELYECWLYAHGELNNG
jgi:hypothetical protein